MPRAPPRRPRGGGRLSEALSYAGAALLFLATLPQAAKLLRTRRADDLAWSFVLLNFVGITLLGLRSVEIRETAFVLLNASTALFWLLAAAVKLGQVRPAAAPTGKAKPAMR